MSEPMKSNPILRLGSFCSVYIDWANVYGWKKSLKREINSRKLFKHLKTYKQIKNFNFYFGTDEHPKSKQFLEDVKQTGYSLTTKPVKYITVFNEKGQRFKFRKCDFDIEICIQAHDDLAKGINSFVFFSGDGDFEPLYQLLHRKKKQVVVVYASGHTGREVLKIERKIYLCNIKKFIQLGYA